MRILSLFGILVLASMQSTVAKDAKIAVGTAKVDVTPSVPVVLAGYGGRTREYEGIDTKLWARAMVIGSDEPVAIVAIDNCGVPAAVVERVAKRLADDGITPGHLVVAATHTHNAPSLVDYAPVVWKGRTTPEQDRLTAEYTSLVVERMAEAVVEALGNRRAMTLEWSQGRVTFGGNRRVLRDGRWTGFGFQRSGPVDHSLPVMAARDESGEVRAVWANYACHCTTVGSRNFVGGDWAGFANEKIEQQFPNAVSLMTIGCGADIGPQPSGSLQTAEKHGETIAAEVVRILADNDTTPLQSAPQVSSKRVGLPLRNTRPREYWETQAKTSGWDAQLAHIMLERLEQGEKIPSEVDYPFTVWEFDDDLAIVFLAGEVVVDYAVRLKSELDWERLWITAWSDDMPGYIPSRRVLLEGGYESEFSQIYYAQPGPYDMRIENDLVAAIKGAVSSPFHARPSQAPSPFHTLPSGEADAFLKLKARVAEEMSPTDAAIVDRIRELLPQSQPALGRVAKSQRSEWYNFAGDLTERYFFRQSKVGNELRWELPVVPKPANSPIVYGFSGGVGWESQPKTAGFELRINDKAQLTFDVTRRPARWVSSDENVELLYLPTWKSDVDSAGFFLLRIAGQPKVESNNTVAVVSLGEGSQRWFAIDTQQPTPALLKKLKMALQPQP